MARTTPDDHVDVERTRTSSVWVAIGVALLFLLLLIVFIAQNNRRVPLHFFTAAGTVSEALALVVAAVAGALVVLLVGSARILQLRLGAHRHNKAAKQQAAAQSAPAAPTTATAPVASEPVVTETVVAEPARPAVAARSVSAAAKRKA